MLRHGIAVGRCLCSGPRQWSRGEQALRRLLLRKRAEFNAKNGLTGSGSGKRANMKGHAGKQINAWRQFFLTMAAIAALGVLVFAGSLTALVLAQAPTAQSPAIPQWQIDAGGKMVFDVASVKQNKSGLPPAGDPPRSNFPLDAGDAYSANGGLFQATNSSLPSYLDFAYKLPPTYVLDQLPKWTYGPAAEHFDIEARAQGNPTKDQMRLMMQSLLADRFKLAVHLETRQGPVYALGLVKSGKTGPQISPHSDDQTCATLKPTDSAHPATDSAGHLPFCGVIATQLASGHLHVSARGISMANIASNLLQLGHLDRVVLDQTGLKGNLDFSFGFVPEVSAAFRAARPDFQPDPAGPTFMEALEEQLGLKLVPQTGPIGVLVIDHLEQPSPN